MSICRKEFETKKSPNRMVGGLLIFVAGIGFSAKSQSAREADQTKAMLCIEKQLYSPELFFAFVLIIKLRG
jgi:hypothetical protein